MRAFKELASVLMVPLLSLALGGCGRVGAPSFVIFGAFFPGWMFCAFLGILVGVVTRIIFVATGVSEILPYQLFVCVSVGLIAGFLTWLFWFG